MQHFPFPASSEKGRPQMASKVNETNGCMTLEHSKGVCVFSILRLQVQKQRNSTTPESGS